MPLKISSKSIKLHLLIYLLLTPCFIIYLPQLLHLSFFAYSSPNAFIELPVWVTLLQNSLYLVISGVLLCTAYFLHHHNTLSMNELKQLLLIAAVGLVITIGFEIYVVFLPYKIAATPNTLSIKQLVAFEQSHLKTHALLFLPLGIFAISLSLFRTKLKQLAFDEIENEHKTSGKFGSAVFAKHNDFTQLNAYQSDNGIFIGTDVAWQNLILAAYVIN